MDISNPFNNPATAAAYNQDRPYFHPLVIDRIRKTLGLSKRVERALDVGCGTGLSSKALLEISDSVDAADASAPMLARAYRDSRIRYKHCRAEELAYPEVHFDLITVSQTIHWTNHEHFFAHAARMLKPACHCVIYDNFFDWEAESIGPFANWYNQRFLVCFPPPARVQPPINAEGQFCPEGFQFTGYQEYKHETSFTLAQLVKFLITQSNIAANADGSERSLSLVVDWLTHELSLFFVHRPSIKFDFGGPIHYLKRG